MDIRGKVILITGANRGIGKALVNAAVKQGAKKIYATARNVSSLELPDDDRFVKLQLDITDSSSVNAIVKQCKDVDVLINNAGIASYASILKGSFEDLQRDMNTNYFGTIQMIRALVPSLIEKQGAAIVNILSVLSLASISDMAGYSASKAALFSATQALRFELKANGVSVFNVYPGPIDTDMAKDINLPKASPDMTAQNIFAGMLEDKEDIFPDPMSMQASEMWMKDPKALERQFANSNA
jgi:NAD(P)-dependent dehydrogenase (short-subunit alcohol dehydrogenase family)